MQLLKPMKPASEDGKTRMVVCTGAAEAGKADDREVLVCCKIRDLFERVPAQDIPDGPPLNPCGDPDLLPEKQIRTILGGV